MARKVTASPRRQRSVVNLRDFMRSAHHPLLCMGPMSKLCVDVVVGTANRLQSPIPLIASRRQIECSEFGGGYVNQWDTRSFADYVITRDHGYVPLCRDHGGPWQGNNEIDLPDAEAMERGKQSMLADLEAGFDVIHIDPSLKGNGVNDPATLEKIFELYAFVCETAKRLGRRVEIEVGAEQQSGQYSSAEELVGFLRSITEFCEARSLQRPLFCVVQTGTLVREMRNVGFTEGRKNESYDQKYAVETMEKQVKHLADIAYINGVYIKEHNGDYLSDGSMSLRRKLRVGAVNIAPELGVYESKALVGLCQELGLRAEAEKILNIFYSSKKWEKWLSADSKATDLEKAIIAGHYTFAKPEFLAAREEVARHAALKGVDLDAYLMAAISAALSRMLWNLGYLEKTIQFAFQSIERSAQAVVNASASKDVTVMPTTLTSPRTQRASGRTNSL